MHALRMPSKVPVIFPILVCPGLPIMVKDLTAVQGLKYTCGSRLYKDRVAGQDDALVTALKAAGAVVVAKVIGLDVWRWCGVQAVAHTGYGAQTTEYTGCWHAGCAEQVFLLAGVCGSHAGRPTASFGCCALLHTFSLFSATDQHARVWGGGSDVE